MGNFLGQLVAEWYEFNGYFVRQNIHVGPRDNGGYDGELDVVVFHPGKKKLKHIEASMDSLSWKSRIPRLQKKFKLGREHIPNLFSDFARPLPKIEQIAILVYAARDSRDREIGGGKILPIGDFMEDIQKVMVKRKVQIQAVPEQFSLLRALQFAANYWKDPATLVNL